MDDFVTSLTHVHSEIDVKNQWKRAINSLALMSNMDIAIAWLHLSKYALQVGNGYTVSELKVIYRRALKEYEQKEAGEAQNDTCYTRHKNINLSADIEKLSSDIKDL